MADRYISEVEKVDRDIASNERKTGYRMGAQKKKRVTYVSSEDDNFLTLRKYRNDEIEGRNIIRDSRYSPGATNQLKGYAMGVANGLMDTEKGMDPERSMNDAILGAKVYEKIGLGGTASVRRRLVANLEKYAEQRPENVKAFSGKVRKFLESNPEKESKLETASKVVAILGFAGAVAFLSTNITGYAIAGQGISTANTVGIISLIVGLIAAWAYSKSR